LHDPLLPDEKLPQLAIRPYPVECVFPKKLSDRTLVTLRPIMPGDEPLMAEFHKTLSETTIHYRYMANLRLQHRITHSRLSRICFNDYDREIALVIEWPTSTTEREIVGVGRLIKNPGGSGEGAQGWRGEKSFLGCRNMARPSLTGCPACVKKNGLKCQGHLRPTKTSATV
jgi:hypothetical protein